MPGSAASAGHSPSSFPAAGAVPSRILPQDSREHPSGRCPRCPRSTAPEDAFCLPQEGLSWQINTSPSANKGHYHALSLNIPARSMTVSNRSPGGKCAVPAGCQSSHPILSHPNLPALPVLPGGENPPGSSVVSSPEVPAAGLPLVALATSAASP